MRITSLSLLLAAGPLAAQSLTGIPAVDSSRVARAAYRRATTTGDAAVTRQEVERAERAWPTQPAYVWANAVVSARAGDSAAAIEALRRYADLGLGRDLARPDFTPLASSAEFRRVRALHDSNRALLHASSVVVTLPDSTIWPEAADFDARSGTWYVGSVRHGTVIRRDAHGVVTNLWAPDSSRGAVMAVRVDTASNLLWATVSGMPQYERFVPADSSLGEVVRVDLTNSVITGRWVLPVVARGHVLGDMTLGPDGDVFVSDSNQPAFYRLHPGGDLVATTSAFFNSPQGIAAAPDGRTLFLADYSLGIMRVDLATGAIHRLEDPPHSTSLGVDGLLYHDHALIGVQNGVSPARIVRFALDESGQRIVRVEVLDRLDGEPTSGTMVGNRFVYVGTSQWDLHADDGRVKQGAVLPPAVLLGIVIR